MNMQKQKPIWSKILAMLCALALCISMVPAASAARPTGAQVTQVTMNVPTGITFYDSYNWDMTDVEDAELDNTDGHKYYTDGAFKYTYDSTTGSLWFKGTGTYLPNTFTFKAQSDYEPSITSVNDGVTVSVSPLASNDLANWIITVSFSNTATGEVTLTAQEGQPETYNVTFAEGNYNVTVTGATATGSGKSYTATEGTDVTFTLTPNEGFTITQVVANETTILKANEDGVYTISNIQENKNIAVTTEQKTYTINFTEASGEKHYTLIKGASSVAHGGSYTFSVIPEEGYNAPTVRVNETPLTPDGGSGYAYTIQYITADTAIAITDGAVQQRTVTFTSGEGYSFVGANNTTISNDKATVNYGGSVSFEVVLGDMYNQSADNVKVYSNGIEIESTNGVYTINNIKVDQTVSVTGVEKNTYQVTLPTDWTGYTISTVDGTSVPAGGTFTFTVTPAAGYTITSVTLNNSSITPNNDNTYIITPGPDKNVIAVVAEQQTYTLITTPNDSTINTGSLHFGNNTITITPNAGYKVDSVTFDGATVAPGTDNKYTIYVTGNEHQLVVTTSPVVEITLTTTVTGADTTVVTVKTSNDWTSGNVEGIKIVGYGTLYSNQTFDPSTLKDKIAGRTRSGESYTTNNITVYNYYYNNAGINLSALTGYTFSYKFNSSNSVSAGSRYGAGWIELQQGDTKWIITTASAVALS